jgi:hypothetical protein
LNGSAIVATVFGSSEFAKSTTVTARPHCEATKQRRPSDESRTLCGAAATPNLEATRKPSASRASTINSSAASSTASRNRSSGEITRSTSDRPTSISATTSPEVISIVEMLPLARFAT